jgi:hypothetical protein
MLQNILGRMPLVRNVVFFDGGKKPKTEGIPNSVQIHSMSSIEALGAKPANLRSKF